MQQFSSTIVRLRDVARWNKAGIETYTSMVIYLFVICQSRARQSREHSLKFYLTRLLKYPLNHWESRPMDSQQIHHHPGAETLGSPTWMFQHCHSFQLCSAWQCLIEWHEKEKTLMLIPGLLFSSKTWSSENQHQVACSMSLLQCLCLTSFCLTQPSQMRSRPMRVLGHEHVSPEISIHSGSFPWISRYKKRTRKKSAKKISSKCTITWIIRIDMYSIYKLWMQGINHPLKPSYHPNSR